MLSMTIFVLSPFHPFNFSRKPLFWCFFLSAASLSSHYHNILHNTNPCIFRANDPGIRNTAGNTWFPDIRWRWSSGGRIWSGPVRRIRDVQTAAPPNKRNSMSKQSWPFFMGFVFSLICFVPAACCDVRPDRAGNVNRNNYHMFTPFINN